MKGIILAGGTGTRLHPVTKVVSKQLLPIYNKPMIFYPLSVLMLAGIKDVLIISTEPDLPRFELLLGDGSNLGMTFTYTVQPNPDGLAQAFLLAKDFIGSDRVCLILGDNFFYGPGFSPLLKEAASLKEGAIIFGYQVNDPQRFGVVEFDDNKQVISIEEKPEVSKSNFAVTGLYFYDNRVVEIAKNLKPSLRGELEITSINTEYLSKNELKVKLLGRGFAWLDTGTHEGLLEASQFVQTVELRQGFKIACLEEIAFNNKWISEDQLLEIANSLNNASNADYLKNIISNFIEPG